MKRLIRSVSRFGYHGVVKPIAFRQEPDKVHARLIKLGKTVQKLPVVRNLPTLWAHRSKMLEVEVAGIKFNNPVGLSAGFDKTIELPKAVKSIGFGWMTGGSVTLGQYAGNQRPWYHRLPNSKSLVVNAGLPSEGTPVVAKRVAGYNTSLFKDFPLNISVAKTNSKQSATDEAAIQDYCESLKTFDKLSQVRMLEINISCPNTFGGEPFTTPDRLNKLLISVDKLKLNKPVFIKMPISLNSHEFDQLTEVIVKHNVTGLAVGNLLKNRKLAKLDDNLPEAVQGNLSGKPNKDIATEHIRRTYKKYGKKLVIIGIGGIMSAEDAFEKIKAGASLVALITGLIYEGPQLIGEINYGLVKLLLSDGYTNISQAVGIDLRK